MRTNGNTITPVQRGVQQLRPVLKLGARRLLGRRSPFQMSFSLTNRCNFRCEYCDSRENLTVDHIVPKSRGGEDTWKNLSAACTSCNNKKGNRTPEEARMPLRRKPFRPSHVMFIRDYVGTVDETWKPYLFLV